MTQTQTPAQFTRASESSDLGTSQVVYLLPRDGELSGVFNLVKFLRTHLGLEQYSRWDDECRYSYENWGNWYAHSDKGRLGFTVGAGCGHEHDCCGCLCGLRVKVEMTEDWFVVTVNRTFNY